MNRLTAHKLVLGSQSPRRKYILEQAGFEFSVIAADVDEVYPADMPVREVPEYLAALKAEAILPQVDSDAVVITSDTIVLLNGKIYEKPKSREHAIQVLGELSGNMHEVITGVCITSADKTVRFSDTTKVFFDKLTTEEIEWYVDRYDVMDKAGGYAVQEGIGLIGIIKLEGCYFNVMGLPVNRLYQELKKF